MLFRMLMMEWNSQEMCMCILRQVEARRKTGGVVMALALFTALSCGPPKAPAPEPQIRLVVDLAVDQMRADYLDRFRPVFRHGLARLLDESVRFTEARHDHGITTTSPGHASLATGLYPSHHGVINNGWWDRGAAEWVTSVGDDEHKRSPHRLLGSSLGGWMKAFAPRTKVFSASAKDRAAILFGGREADAAFWIDTDTGDFTSSSYYQHGKPAWLKEFNRRGLPAAEFGKLWEAAPLPAGGPSPAELGVLDLDRGAFPKHFPHPVGDPTFTPDEDFFDALTDTPFADRYLVEFARAVIEGEGLGDGGPTDLLALSFSAVDLVGHGYGPDSPEMLATLVNLDRALGELLTYLDARIGKEHLLLSLSADHGVVPLPEAQRLRGRPGERLGPETFRCLQGAGAAIAGALGKGQRLNPFGYFEPPGGGAAAALARYLGGCPAVARAWTGAELSSAGIDAEPVGRLYAHSYFRERSPDVLVQFAEGFLPILGDGTTHGTPYDDDRHVPWLLRLPHGEGTTIAEPVATVDVAPTLAALLGVPVPKDRDGKDRSGLVTRTPAAPATPESP